MPEYVNENVDAGDNANNSDKDEGHNTPISSRHTSMESYEDNNKYGDTPAKGSIRAKIFQCSVAQAKQKNNRGTKRSNDALDVGDICNVEIEGKICGAQGGKYLPVAVMEVLHSQKG